MAAQRSGELSKIHVSVIIANYNGEKFIADAVRSACDQSHRNIEISFPTTHRLIPVFGSWKISWPKMPVFVSSDPTSMVAPLRPATGLWKPQEANGSASWTVMISCIRIESGRCSNKQTESGC